MTDKKIKERLKYLKGEIEAGSISYGEIAELQSLAEYIDKGDVQLLEWAGVPEFEEKRNKPIICPNCNKPTLLNEIVDGQWTTTTYEWVNETGEYKEIGEDTDGDGERYLECDECSERLSEKCLKKFDKIV